MNDYKKPKEQSLVWRWRWAVYESDLSATTKHILQTISARMDPDGTNCYPSVLEVAQLSGHDRKTVRKHLYIAETQGWLTVELKGWGGPQHARKEYSPRWPDNVNVATSPAMINEEMDPARWGVGSPTDGAALPAYNTNPLTSPNTTPIKDAGARGPTPVDRARIREQFLLWLAAYPKFQKFSDGEARKYWIRLTERDRRECIRLTPAYFRWIGKGKHPSPQHYLRDKAWEGVPPEVSDKPELIDAKSFSPLWMVTRFWMLFQPPTGTYVLTTFDRNRADKSEVEVRLEKQAVYGWPNVNAMMAGMKKGAPFSCPTKLEPLTATFKSVKKDSDLYEAWSRSHGRRGWPFFNFAPNYVPFPAVDLGVTDHDAAVEAAIAELETLISKV